MTVAELIERLKLFPDNLPVVLCPEIDMHEVNFVALWPKGKTDFDPYRWWAINRLAFDTDVIILERILEIPVIKGG